MELHTPLYRYELDGCTSPVTCAANAATNIDFLITDNFFMYGGELIVSGAVMGDYIEAVIYDVDSIIPVEYRDANWPVMGQFIKKRYISLLKDLILDQKPDVSQINEGLYVRVIYNAVNSGSSRTAVVNFFMVQS